MVKNGWSRVHSDDNKVYIDDLKLPFRVIEEEGVGVEFRELLEENGFGTDITEFAALIVAERPDVVERLGEDYDGSDVQDAKEYCREKYEEGSPEEILDGLLQPQEIPDGISAEDARQLKEQFHDALNSAADDGPTRAFEAMLEDNSDD